MAAPFRFHGYVHPAALFVRVRRDAVDDDDDAAGWRESVATVNAQKTSVSLFAQLNITEVCQVSAKLYQNHRNGKKVLLTTDASSTVKSYVFIDKLAF